MWLCTLLYPNAMLLFALIKNNILKENTE
jgi:hypothetical protein